MGWALATHGPRGYFYALVTQLPISDLPSTVIFVEEGVLNHRYYSPMAQHRLKRTRDIYMHTALHCMLHIRTYTYT